MPVIPATQEAEAGELPEPRRQRLRWAQIAPLHSSLGNKSETPSQKKKKIYKQPDEKIYILRSQKLDQELTFQPKGQKLEDNGKVPPHLWRKIAVKLEFCN